MFSFLDGQGRPEQKNGKIQDAEWNGEQPPAKRKGRPKVSKSKPKHTPSPHP